MPRGDPALNRVDAPGLAQVHQVCDLAFVPCDPERAPAHRGLGIAAWVYEHWPIRHDIIAIAVRAVA
jgi:hypothetical protein